MDMDLFIKAFTGFFVVMGPFDKLAIFISLTSEYSIKERKHIALKSTVTAFLISLFFMLFGFKFLNAIGISIDALRISGGIFLMVIAMQMLFSANVANDYGEDEQKETLTKEDISIFPLAIPLIVGAGAISFAILLSAEAKGDVVANITVISAMTLVLFITYVMLFIIGYVQKFMGKTFNNIIVRLSGILLGGLAVQFTLDGLKGAGVF